MSERQELRQQVREAESNEAFAKAVLAQVRLDLIGTIRHRNDGLAAVQEASETIQDAIDTLEEATDDAA